ncbi:MAG: hypothetical protein BWY86_00979 [Candidatus Aminicenantes bacterium ADurb.Bin508]|nr:MAG: hypothetical protein BWY86_00979 [Candidatus Aminicenantes bacterium ADurb.Bin508]
MAFEPHHGVASPGPSHGPHPFRIHVRKGREVLGDLIDVLHDLSGIVPRDGRRVSLTEPRRPMGVGKGDDVPRSGIDLPIPSERVTPHGLGTAVNVEDQGVFLDRIEVVRLHDEELNLLAVGAVHPNLFGGTDIDFVAEGFVEEGQPLRLSLVPWPVAPELDGFAHRRARED